MRRIKRQISALISGDCFTSAPMALSWNPPLLAASSSCRSAVFSFRSLLRRSKAMPEAAKLSLPANKRKSFGTKRQARKGCVHWPSDSDLNQSMQATLLQLGDLRGNWEGQEGQERQGSVGYSADLNKGLHQGGKAKQHGTLGKTPLRNADAVQRRERCKCDLMLPQGKYERPWTCHARCVRLLVALVLHAFKFVMSLAGQAQDVRVIALSCTPPPRSV